ncbi:AfsR family transcriptional regulator [Streptomyces sp. R302]|uniref:AfsR/SARP family transcriptional regulator n=1 Tax=unclassified Streptomyces TaxID=2593676 RepID=UPI00145ECB45|nr:MULTISPECIES: AfsR/SARP family transcriptional regulator [unclassified Streptomyces]NML51044.1 AfsR family transcriptional regulator [Streptomyces sp. R301]NML81139.1 AfsR family transcriptional regulator [Streptomyces sp. R302]
MPPLHAPAPDPGAVRFSVLGPLSAHHGPRELPLGPLKQRVVLAMLLGSPNTPVSVEALTDAVWPEEPPRTARKNLQVYVSALRTLLPPEPPAPGGARERIAHTSGGYVLRVAEEELDALRFRSLVRAAEGRPPRTAARLLRRALDLWQGPPLGGLRRSPRLAEEAERLELRHLTVYEDWAEAELELGGAPGLVEGLRDLVERHPLRERLRAAWMSALHGAGRQAEALAVYDDYRQLLARELGLEPGGAMTARYRAILTGADTGRTAGGGTPGAARRGAGTVLPPDIGDFTGHDEELRELLDALADDGRGPGHGGAVLLTGPAGAGKTALAVRAGHLLADQFEDGRFLVAMRDADGVRRPLDAVLAELALLTGASAPDLPPAEAWRGWLAEHRALVVLDDVPDEESVRPLISWAGQGRVLLTARGRLGGLAPVHRVDVPPLEPEGALELLGGIVGRARVRADREAALRIVRACGLLPLAVRVSGTRLAVLRHMPLREFADRLADPAGVLDELTAGDLSVRRRLGRDWDELPPGGGPDAERLAARTPEGPFTLPEAADALGLDEGSALRAVETLIGAGLLTSPRSEVSAHAALYELPHLVRLYARERAAQDETGAVRSPLLTQG